MKRILIALALLATVTGGRAQNTDSTLAADTGWWAQQNRMQLNLGLQAGATLFSNMYDESPYTSKYGFTVQLPLMFSYRVSPHWRLSAGLRSDFSFDPLLYAVRVNPGENSSTNGLDFESGTVSGSTRKNAWVLRLYMGVPLEATWYPWPREPRLLSVSFDIFAGYSPMSVVNIYEYDMERTINGGTVTVGGSEGIDGTDVNDPTLLPWKLEMGITVSTDVLGLLHGVRFFANFLPNYRDPLTGFGHNNIGMTLYL